MIEHIIAHNQLAPAVNVKEASSERNIQEPAVLKDKVDLEVMGDHHDGEKPISKLKS